MHIPFPATILSLILTIPLSIFSQTGNIKGTVTFTGVAKQGLFKHNVSPESCGKEQALERLVIGKNNGVQYTLLYLKNPPPGSTANMKPATIDQRSCRYVPHMVIAAKGSTLEVTNSDDVLHTSHGFLYKGMSNSTAFNIAQPIKGHKAQQPLRNAGMIEIKCDAGHVWMSAWVWVTPSPFCAITNENGEFSIDGIAPGTYTLVMWHEGWDYKMAEGGTLAFSPPIAQEREVTVTAGNTTTINFELR